MKLNRTVPITLACVIALTLLIAGAFVLNSNKVQAEPPGDQPPQDSPTLEWGDFGPIALAETNDMCADAEAITPFILLPMPGQPAPPPPDSYSVGTDDRHFYNGNSVDDWYSYTTHALPCAGGSGVSTMLLVSVVSDNPQIEVEIYQYCFNWPIDTTMYEVHPSFGDDPPTVEILSGLSKNVAVTNPLENFTYYIHVNYLSPPDGGGTITYDLEIEEYCTYPPR